MYPYKGREISFYYFIWECICCQIWSIPGNDTMFIFCLDSLNTFRKNSIVSHIILHSAELADCSCILHRLHAIFMNKRLQILDKYIRRFPLITNGDIYCEQPTQYHSSTTDLVPKQQDGDVHNLSHLIFKF